MDEGLKRALAPYIRRLRREAALRSGVNAGLTVLPVALAAAVYCHAAGRALPVAACALGAWLLLAAALYALLYRPTQREAARRIDALGLHDAVGTAVEYQGSASGMCRMQREQALCALQGVKPQQLSVRVPKRRGVACLCLLAALCVLCAWPVQMKPSSDMQQTDSALDLLAARLDALRETIETSELRASDRAELLAQLNDMQAQLAAGQLDVAAIAELSRRLDELAGTVGQLTPVDTYAEALMEQELLRAVGEAIAAEDETKLAEAFDAMESDLDALSGAEQINALMDVVYAIGGSMRRPVRDERQDVLAHAFAVLSGELESAVAMVYNRQNNEKKIAGAFDNAQARVLDFFAGKDLERQQAAQEEEPVERQRSHWADRPGENEIDYAAVETVFEPARAALPEDYVPGALGADGQAQRIAAPESVEGEVPFGEVYADYYAAFLQEQLPMALRETAADYLMNLK